MEVAATTPTPHSVACAAYARFQRSPRPDEFAFPANVTTVAVQHAGCAAAEASKKASAAGEQPARVRAKMGAAAYDTMRLLLYPSNADCALERLCHATSREFAEFIRNTALAWARGRIAEARTSARDADANGQTIAEARAVVVQAECHLQEFARATVPAASLPAAEYDPTGRAFRDRRLAMTPGAARRQAKAVDAWVDATLDRRRAQLDAVAQNMFWCEMEDFQKELARADRCLSHVPAPFV